MKVPVLPVEREVVEYTFSPSVAEIGTNPIGVLLKSVTKPEIEPITPCLESPHQHKQTRHENHRPDDRAQVVFDPGEVAKQVTGTAQADHPNESTDDVVGRELAAAHVGDAGDKRRKGANERHEARQDDGDAAVAFVKVMRLVKRAFVEEAGVFPLKHLGPEVTADGEVALVAQNSRYQQDSHRHRQADQTDAAQSADDEQQRVTRQKRHHHHTGFDKDDGKQQRIDPHAVMFLEGLQVAVAVRIEAV